MAFLKTGKTQTEIARGLNRSKSTISRELRRNSANGVYHPDKAQELALYRRQNSLKFHKNNDFVVHNIKEWLLLRWSPEAISARLSVELPSSLAVCHTTIYKWVEKDRLSGGKLHTFLPRFGKRRKKGGKRKQAGVSLIPDRTGIEKRPKIVEKRERIGDWEGDTVYGQNASLVTLVDRKSRYTLCKRVYSKSKIEVTNAINQLFGAFKGRKHTLTLDNGGEFSDHFKIKKRHGIDVYFADPYASWQRGTNENTNGRLRRVWPKKFDMATLSEKEIENRIFLLNITPRKVLNGLTPLEVFTGRHVALIT